MDANTHLLKDFNDMVVPMNARSYPNIIAPIDATIARRYTRKLYISFGTGVLVSKDHCCWVGAMFTKEVFFEAKLQR